jgi:NAD(P)-dependent dehydrogenase (short-subunit alcohol dehydrogenase family)
MDLNLNGRLALVSGSTRGIGYAAAEGLAAAGAHVIVNGRTAARCDAAALRIREKVAGAQVSVAPYDVSGAAGVAALVSAFPGVDVLVNNVGIFDVKPFEDIPDSEWTRFFESNVMSGVRLSRAYLPHMRAKKWGRIVFVSSESGLNIPVEMVHYGMTKTAQLAVARGIAEGVAEMEREFFRSARPSSLLQRFATVDEVANAIVYLCSPAASATNGSAMRVDGGVVRSIA